MDVFTLGEEECLAVLARVKNRTSLFQFESSSSFQIKWPEIGLESFLLLLVLITVSLSQLLVDDGFVWCWGYNISDGQLGFDGENSLAPCLIKNFYVQEAATSSLSDSGRQASSDIKICAFKGGSMMSLAIDMGKEWGEMLENADKNQLMRLQAFYEGMISRVRTRCCR